MIGVSWLGWDGSLWDLRRGPVTIASVQGLRHVPFESVVRRSPSVAGQEFVDWNPGPREVPLGINITGTSELDWWTKERSFMRTIRPDRPGTLLVSSPGALTRRIQLRLNESEDEGDEGDPSEEWGSSIVLPMIADDPWYRGEQHHASFGNSSPLPRNTFPGFPLYFPSAIYTGEVTVRNNGDVPSHGLWTMYGPLSRFEVEVAGGMVAGTLDVADRERILVNTAPSSESVLLVRRDGTEVVVSDQLEAVDFRPIPAGQSVTVAARVFGEGSATVVFDELHLRGF